LAPEPILQLLDVELGYNRAAVIHGVSLQVESGHKTALLGANGAGKSTLLKGISGFLRCRKGSITFEGEDISRLAPADIVKRGLVHVPEGRRVFPTMTVEENLKVAGYLHRSKIAERMEGVLASFPSLTKRFKTNAGLLSGGEQQMLSIGRAMMHGPRLLLLDELSLGLAPIVSREVYQILDRTFTDMSVLLVEQNAKAALAIADRGYVLETGRIILEENAEDLLANRDVQRAYLGRDLDTETKI